MSQQELSESQLFFDMSRLNRKRLKQREDKDILEGIFLGNATCTSLELQGKRQDNEGTKVKNEENKRANNASLILNLIDAERFFNKKLDDLKCLNQRVETNLEKIQQVYEKSAFHKPKK